jgi:hypothetical protein
LGLSNVLDTGRYEVTFDSNSGFKTRNIKTGATTVFERDADGLFSAPLGPKPYKNQVSLLTTVSENKKLYSKRQVERAETARKLYQVIGFPSLRDFKHVVQTNQIKNCPVNLEDIKICEKIFGPDIYAMKGKVTRKQPKAVINDYVEVPKGLIDAQKEVVLCVDIMFVDEVAFLVTVSKYIKYITVRFIEDRKSGTILEAVQHVFTTYNSAGFNIKEIHCDREFEHLEMDLESEFEVRVNLTTAQEHQPDIERALRNSKERYRAMYNLCPFKMWPKLMIIRGASVAVKWLNSFPPAGGLSAQYSPTAIILGRPIDYDTHCLISFGSFVQAYSRREPTNAGRTNYGCHLPSVSGYYPGWLRSPESEDWEESVSIRCQGNPNAQSRD